MILAYCDDRNLDSHDESYSLLVDVALILGFALKFSGIRSLKSSQVSSRPDKILHPHKGANSLSAFMQYHQTFLQFSKGDRARVVQDGTYRESILFSVLSNLGGST